MAALDALPAVVGGESNLCPDSPDGIDAARRLFMAQGHDQVNEVLQATDIVEVIGEQIRLERKGKDFVGLCPFHDDSRPSMYVVPSKQIFHCFACGKGGDAIRFVREFHKFEFVEALRFLAERAGIKLEQWKRQDAGVGGLQAAMKDAMQFFRSNLAHADTGAEARRYIAGRAIDPETVEAFQLGYAPDGWDALVNAAAAKGWRHADLEGAGVIASKEAGGHYDRLRHRLVFPICNHLGRPIAFGGRRLREADNPKYLNTPETPLFDKSETLYGLHLSRKAIIDQKQAVVVEGYTDVIACHQAKIYNVVGTLGTALTPKHMKQLRRLAERVVLLFDPDEAGRRAADRATEIFLKGELDVAIAMLPDELDPADLLARPDGVERWNEAMGNAIDALAYQFQVVQQQLEGQSSVAGRQQVTEEYLRRVAELGLERQDPIRRGIIYRQMAGLLHMREDEIARMIRGFRPKRRRAEVAHDAGQGPSASSGEGSEKPSQLSNEEKFTLDVPAPRIAALKEAERQLIGALLRKPALFNHLLPEPEGQKLCEAVKPEHLVTGKARQLYEVLYPHMQDGNDIVLNELARELSAQDHDGLVDLVTGIDAEMEKRCGEEEDALVGYLCGAAAKICGFHKELAYDETKQNEETSREGKEARLLSIVAQRKSGDYPGSIGRGR